MIRDPFPPGQSESGQGHIKATELMFKSILYYRESMHDFFMLLSESLEAPWVFLMCMLAEIRCSACNSVKLLCVCDIEEITVITEWLVIHIPIEGSYNKGIQ